MCDVCAAHTCTYALAGSQTCAGGGGRGGDAHGVGGGGGHCAWGGGRAGLSPQAGGGRGWGGAGGAAGGSGVQVVELHASA